MSLNCANLNQKFQILKCDPCLNLPEHGKLSGTAVRSRIAEELELHFCQTVAGVYQEENRKNVFKTRRTDLLASDNRR